MRWLPAAVCALFLVAPANARAAHAVEDQPQDVLPSCAPNLPLAVVRNAEPESFDLLELRAEARATPAPPAGEAEPHSHFGFKQHVGFAAGYDNGILHGSLGMYLTVVEWGRWNYGIPSPALGFGRYQKYDRLHQRLLTQDESTIFISLASVHYRVGYLQSIGMNWYINLEQIFDLRQNMAGSQVGITLSSK
jgi:hypothetical protein